MNKIKLFFTSILGIKVFASIVFGAVACALITVCISASFALAGIVVGFWIDEVIYLNLVRKHLQMKMKDC